jgi:superfamily II DNA or RNA helicase/predicted nucleotidyltransferase
VTTTAPTTLEQLAPGVRVHGILPDGAVEVVQVTRHGSAAVTLTYRRPDGQPDHEMLYRDDEARLRVEETGDGAWALDGDPALFRLASEALRLRLAHLFDPYLAVHTSNLEPLPHQITAVYEEMLPRQPLRFLLADDPGAGKTIMAGLLIKELIVRGDLRRCLIVAPGSLVEQWQDELWRKLGLDFDLVGREMVESSRSGNPFAERNLIVSRLDHLSRNEDIQAKLRQTDWDLVVVDEAHKMSAHYFGNEVKETARYRLGRLLGEVSRNLLLMTATPHSGKDDDFQLFMQLLDADRFEGRARRTKGVPDTQGLMRRLVKEKLLKFDGRPLFPERRASTIAYELSDPERSLYDAVTDYVREEMNRADRLAESGEGRRGTIVGFALTILQRRLASSPEAIYRSLQRRRERLERRVRDEQRPAGRSLDDLERRWRLDDLEGLDEAPEDEAQAIQEAVVDEASAARTVEELQHEIATLRRLEELALAVRNSRSDRKWDELNRLLQDHSVMKDERGAHRKLIVFTEHRDTLHYLEGRITTLFGRREAVVSIHGGVSREDRRRAQETFVNDPDAWVLVATDAAGEGVNLQRANLLVNYDLPWNPNRLEQRFGRIHRIGQTEVCHMWNLVAADTREGQVFERLLTKLERQSLALGGQVFDVLSEVFEDEPLRDLLLKAIRYGERPEVRARLDQVVDAKVGESLRDKLRERALVSDVLSPGDVEAVRARMEEAETRKLQPHFIRAFFQEAFRLAGGRIVRREPGRFEITHVPAAVRDREEGIGAIRPLVRRYERVTFEKDLVSVPGMPLAELLAPGHPLLDATVDLILERHRPLLKRGTVLVADADSGADPRALIYLQDAVQSATLNADGSRRVVSRRLQFVEVTESGDVRSAGHAPYLDYRPPDDEERELLSAHLAALWLARVEERALDHAITEAVPEHLAEVRERVVDQVERTMAAVKSRLTQQIAYWDHRAEELKASELAGKTGRLNSARARQRADELHGRLERRLEELEREKQLSPVPPTLVGGALVVPAGLLARLGGEVSDDPASAARETERVDRAAVDAVLRCEEALGRRPREMAHNHKGYDVLSRDPVTEKLHFIEVKGRAVGAETVTVSKNQILTALNKPDAFILALVKVWPDDSTELRYLETPFKGDEAALFDVTSVTFDFAALWEKGTVPAPPERPPIEHWIELMTERIVAQFSPERIVLFGSHARGDAHGDSDVDLLVIFDEVESQHELGVQIRTAVADVHVPKDIVVRSTEEVRRRGSLVGTVLKPALEDGRVLYARS